MSRKALLGASVVAAALALGPAAGQTQDQEEAPLIAPDQLALLRAEPGLYGPVASDATISRTISTLANDIDQVEHAVASARAAARSRVWALAGEHAPNRNIDVTSPLVIDVDATLVTSHSDKENTAPTFKHGYGFHPICAFLDHGPDGTGEALTMLLRPGNAGSNTAADHERAIKTALAGVPGIKPARPGKIKIKGEVEQKLLELACSDPPVGRCHWTLQMLADELVVLGLLDRVSVETVRQALKKTTSSRGSWRPGASHRWPTLTLSGAWRM